MLVYQRVTYNDGSQSKASPNPWGLWHPPVTSGPLQPSKSLRYCHKNPQGTSVRREPHYNQHEPTENASGKKCEIFSNLRCPVLVGPILQFFQQNLVMVHLLPIYTNFPKILAPFVR